MLGRQGQASGPQRTALSPDTLDEAGLIRRVVAGEPRAFETINSKTCVVGVTLLGDEPALSQNAEMPAHRRSRRPERVREIARFARFFPQKIDDSTARGIGQREERSIERFSIVHGVSRL